jgi:uncharacterized protein YxjI
MKYIMTQSWFALGDDVAILDEKGRQAFRLGGLPFTFGEKLSFRDRRDTELAFVSQKMQEWGPTYEIYHGDDLQAVVRKDRFNRVRCKFSTEAAAPDDLHAEGNLGDREYAFKREGCTVGRVSKSLSEKRGTYGVEVGRGEDEILLLASAVVIDLCCQNEGDHATRALAGR